MLVISLMRALFLSSRPGTFCLAVQSTVNAKKIQNLIILIFQNISPIREHAIYSDQMSEGVAIEFTEQLICKL